MLASISINGGPRLNGTMDRIDDERSEIVLGGLLLQADTSGSFLSVCVDNSLNAATTKNVVYEGCVDCQQFSFPANTDPAKQHRPMCRSRFTFGDPPPRRSTKFEFAVPRQATWKDDDWQNIAPGSYGPLATNIAGTGARPPLSIHHVNWFQHDGMLRAYADHDGDQPVAAREAAAPYAPICRDGFTMGYNSFSHESWKAGNRTIGLKFEIPHATFKSTIAYEAFGDRFYRDSILFAGNYAAQYNWPMPVGQCWSQPRGIGRALTMMIDAENIESHPYRRQRLLDGIMHLDFRASDLFSIQRAIEVVGGEPIISWWMMAYIAYALNYAIESGIVESSAYLDALLDFQLRLTPESVGTFMPYQFKKRDQSGAWVLSNMVATNKEDREAELYVMGEIMRRRGGTPQRPLSELMQDEAKYPIRNHAGFFIADSMRPVKPWQVTVGTEAATIPDFGNACVAAHEMLLRAMNNADRTKDFEATVKIARQQ